ncbi:hypothetical protein [Paenibacillus sp. NPDC058071]|uniref:hypothetical protein n=1 Tax=Paenibacillus sp. NPDC058071 TaxID=3346326 RepID=UPI0036DAE4C3
MFHKTIISRAAISALLITSASCVSSAQASHYTVINSFTDPVALARSYASETAEAWAQTLNAYGELANGYCCRSTESAKAGNSGSTANGGSGRNFENAGGFANSVNGGNFENTGSVANTGMARTGGGCGSDANIENAGSTGSGGNVVNAGGIENTGNVVSDGCAGSSGNGVNIGNARNLGNTGGIESAGNERHAWSTGNAAESIAEDTEDADLVFVRAEIALAMAVEGGNAASIKKALDRLLQEYERQIAQLSTAA